MADYAHFDISDAMPFFVDGVGPRPIRGVIMHNTVSHDAWWYKGRKTPPPHIAECESVELAAQLIEKHREARKASLRDVNDVFHLIHCPWALVGPKNLTLMIPTLHRQGPQLRDMKEWVKGNCEGDVCILSGTYKRRISFATEDDYLLGHLTFHGTF